MFSSFSFCKNTCHVQLEPGHSLLHPIAVQNNKQIVN